MKIELSRGRRTTLLISLGVILMIAAIILAIRHKINVSIYKERQEMLSLVTGTSAALVNQNAHMTWEQEKLLSNAVENTLRQGGDISACFENGRHLFNDGNGLFFLVDTDGKYYSSDGNAGKISDLTPYGSQTDDKITYLSSRPGSTDLETSMIYRERFSKPIRTQVNGVETDIAFISYVEDLDPVRDAVTQLYKGSNNVFIYDAKGTMLYKDFGISLLIDGFNIYPKFEASRITFGEKAEDMVQTCKDRKPLVVSLHIDSKEYYFCSAPLDLADWSLALIVQEEYMGGMGHGFFSGIILYVSLIALILGAALLMLLYATMKRKSTAEKLTQSERLAEAMSDASRAKSEFLSNMSHDIRTPINGIMGITTIAKGNINNPEKIADCLGKIDGASHHLLSLINDVLDMSRIESGKTKITTAPADIRTIMDNCGSIVKGQMEGRDIDFTLDIDAQHTAVLADELHIRQVLINILGNAVKFTRDGGYIRFFCHETAFTPENVTYEIKVSDSGIGMSREFLERIFDPFSQEENRERTHYKGTGLGMAISKQLVDLMGGDISVDSEIGKGSTFTVTLTLDRDLTLRGEKKTAAQSDNINGVRILLAEDNELNTEIAVELLSSSGAEVDTVSDGKEAVRKFSENAPGTYDVILMDIMMPEMNGLEATRAIRAMERDDAKHIPIIAMTANAFDDDVKATRDAGMNAHLSKPIDIHKVISTIAYHCSKTGDR